MSEDGFVFSLRKNVFFASWVFSQLMGSWWLNLAFQPIYRSPIFPTKRLKHRHWQTMDSKSPTKGSLHLIYWWVCRCIVQVATVANEKWGNEKGETVTEDDLVDRGIFFLVEIWSTTFGRTELWEYFLVCQVFHFFWGFSQCLWIFHMPSI